MSHVIRDKEKIKAELKDLLDSLVEIAKEDGVITDDEANIIDEVGKGIEDLEHQVFQILNSDLSETDFKELTNEILKTLVYNATKVAMQDEVLTEDENRLLKKLEEFTEKGI